MDYPDEMIRRSDVRIRSLATDRICTELISDIFVAVSTVRAQGSSRVNANFICGILTRNH